MVAGWSVRGAGSRLRRVDSSIWAMMMRRARFGVRSIVGVIVRLGRGWVMRFGRGAGDRCGRGSGDRAVRDVGFRPRAR